MKRLMILFFLGSAVLFIGNLILVACDDSNAAIGDLELVEEEAVFPLTWDKDFGATAVCPEGKQILSGACKIVGDTDFPDGYNLESSGGLIFSEISLTGNSYRCVWGEEYDTQVVKDELTFVAQALCG